jgi:hypothetical protein
MAGAAYNLQGGWQGKCGGSSQVAAEPEPVEEQERVELKDPGLSAFLAWLIPGLGHLYQGRTAKAILFFVCIMGTFVYGVCLGGRSDLGWGRAVYFSWRPNDKRLNFLCQIWIGLPAFPALIQANRVKSGAAPIWGGFMAPPRIDGDGGGPTLDDLNNKLSGHFELATAYTMIAGLLNILVIFDAWAGPVFPERKEEDEEEEKKKKSPKDKQPQEEGKPDSPDQVPTIDTPTGVKP